MAWGKPGGASTSKQDFEALCGKIATNKTTSNSLTLLHSKYHPIWNAETIALLCRSVETNTSLEELHCTGFDFGVDGCALLGRALRHNRTLKRLTFGHHSTFSHEQLASVFPDGEEEEEATALTSLEELDFERKNLTAASGAVLGRVLAAARHPVALVNISGNEAMGNAGLEALLLSSGAGINPLLARLVACGISLTAVPPQLALRLTSLVSINLSDNAIGAEGMLELAKLDCDEVIVNNCEAGDAGCIALALGKPRKRLSLSRNQLTHKGVAMLAQCFLLALERKLEYLNVSHNTSLGNDGLDVIAQNLELHARMFPTTTQQHKHKELVLDASYCNATRVPAAFFAHLDGLNFGGNGPLVVDELVSVVQQHHATTTSTTTSTMRVATLGLTGTGLTDIARLFQALHVKCSLAVLECGGIPMTPEDRAALEQLNEINPHLDVAVDRGENDGQAPE